MSLSTLFLQCFWSKKQPKIFILGMEHGAPVCCWQPKDRAPVRWGRMLVRLLARNRWHWQGILLWMIQRPYLRGLPPPLPSVSTPAEWEHQTAEMCKRRSWPRKWAHSLMRQGEKFTLFHLKDSMHLRDRMGLELSFMEDDAILFGIQALKKKPRRKMQEALVMETQRLLQLNDADRTMQLRSLLGPRGGLPRLKDELVKTATLLNTKVEPNETVEQLRRRLQPIVKDLMAKPEWVAPPISPPESVLKSKAKAKPKPSSVPLPARMTPASVFDLPTADRLIDHMTQDHLAGLSWGEPRMPREAWDANSAPQSPVSEIEFHQWQADEEIADGPWMLEKASVVSMASGSEL